MLTEVDMNELSEKGKDGDQQRDPAARMEARVLERSTRLRPGRELLHQAQAGPK